MNGDRNEDTAAICDECLGEGMHLRCMEYKHLELWEETHVWLCNSCTENQSDNEDAERLGNELENFITNLQVAAAQEAGRNIFRVHSDFSILFGE